MRKMIPAAILTAMTLVGVAGCSGGSDSSDSGSGGTTTLDVVAFEGGGSEPAGIPEINAAFEKKYPDVKLNFKYVANTEYDQYNNTRLAAGTAADVLLASTTRMRQWEDQGYLTDLSDQPWVSRQLPNTQPYGQIDGKTYGFVQQNMPVGMYANMDLLKKAGIDQVPTDFPSLLADLKTLKDGGYNGFLLPNLTGWSMEPLSQSLAANLVDPDWALGYDAGTTHFDPTWAPVIDRIKDLLTEGQVDGKTMNGIEPFNAGLGEFETGDWAFIIQGGWSLQAIEANAKFAFTFNPMPGGDAGTEPKTATFIGSQWTVNAASKNQQAAKDYVNFMSQPEQDAIYLKAENSFSTLTDVPAPDMPNATAIGDAFAAGNTSPAPIAYLRSPKAEQSLWDVGTSLFNDPSQSTSDLLQKLDSTIPATK